jgi:hypothetical protein
MYGYTPNERIVDKAVELWISMLSKPKYDNLGTDLRGQTFEEFAPSLLAAALTDKLPKNNTPDVLVRFGAELKKFLMEPTEYTYTNYKGEVVKDTRLFNYLSVDYHPDTALAIAAERAGLKMEFPWKTHMTLTETYVCVSNGYGAPYVYYYPLSSQSNYKWLATTLNGEDISKIIKLIEGGYLDDKLNPI